MPSTSAIYEQVGRSLRECRTQAGLTQQALAEHAGLSVSFVSFLESGRKKGSLETYQRLARALGIPLADLFRSGAPADWPRRKPAAHLAGLNVAERQAIWRLVTTFRRRRKS